MAAALRKAFQARAAAGAEAAVAAAHPRGEGVEDLSRFGDAQARPVLVGDGLDLGLDLGLGQAGERDEVGGRSLALALPEDVDEPVPDRARVVIVDFLLGWRSSSLRPA